MARKKTQETVTSEWTDLEFLTPEEELYVRDIINDDDYLYTKIHDFEAIIEEENDFS